MPQKIAFINGIGEVTLAKRRGTRSLRLSVNSHGRIRVGMPYWLPYSAGIRFAKDRREWINEQQLLNPQIELTNGMRIGKQHDLKFEYNQNLSVTRSKIKNNIIIVSSPHETSHPITQLRARQAAERALRNEALELLPARLSYLAKKHGYSYSAVKIKKMNSRWGSCSSKNLISLSYFLIQLPWDLIDYVILHELVHTKHLNHGKDFWRALESFQPNARAAQKRVKIYKPRIEPWNDLI